MKLILGSQSPRRRELLAGLDVPFEAISIDVDESFPSHLQEGDIPKYIARAKARAYENSLQENELLLTSDTIVWLEGQMMGKPHSEEEAEQMIRQLSGKTHQVYTGVCLLRRLPGGELIEQLEVDRTDVTFRSLTDEEVHFYVENYRPLDKAGAYGIQEWIGYVGCVRLEGSYFNVMGFPTEKVYNMLKNADFC